MVALLRKLEAEHPRLRDFGPRAQDMRQSYNASAGIPDALLPVRPGSMAHPNAELLGEPEARLIINVGRTLLLYLDSKFS